MLTPEGIRPLEALGLQDPGQQYWRRIPGQRIKDVLGYVAVRC